MDTLKLEKRNELIKAFRQLKQNVLWKWENDFLPNKPENVVIRNWLPQLSVLCTLGKA